jgi:hypothetical protein
VPERAAAYWDNGQPLICAREHPNAFALCGAEPFSTIWTNDRRSYVTCPGCSAEIERRLAAQGQRAKAQSSSCGSPMTRPFPVQTTVACVPLAKAQ